MSFLAPLFMAGFLAVTLPIIFHLIRRTPRGRLPFSSLMFLEASPPSVTRRSRLDNWLLLLLRALAVCLLAIAFARPFFRETANISTERFHSRRIAILLDTSASMRRGTLFRDAVRQAQQTLNQTDPQDQVGIFAFDREWKPILTFEEWSSLQPEARKETARQRLKQIAPGWGATNLGRALMETAEVLEAISTGDEEDSRQRIRELLLFSDLQSGSRIHDLQTFSWPETVTLTVQQVKTSDVTNAGLQLIAEQQSFRIGPGEETLRVRITNAADSQSEQFRLQWTDGLPANSQQQQSEHSLEVYVPPGTSRVVRIPLPHPSSSHTYRQLLLTGDNHDFDNRVFVDRPASETLTVVYFGSESESDSQQLRYYLERAFPTEGRRIVKLIAQDSQAPPLLSATKDVHLVIVSEPLPESHLQAFQQFIRNGGTLLYIAQSDDDCRTFGRLIEAVDLEGHEADVEDYALLGDIEFTHPLFVDFSEARFADFTKIYFWKHRVLSQDSLPSECRILARFDDGSPAILETPFGKGKAFLFTAGWRPQESQFALSSKFAPLMNRLLELAAGRTEWNPYYTVGDAVPLKVVKAQEERDRKPVMLTVQLPDQSEILLVSGQSSFRETVSPGIYRVRSAQEVGTETEKSRQFAVNLDADESKTSPMPLEQLEALDIRLTDSSREKASAATLSARNRQLRSRELENRQKIWRWLIVAALIVLAAETILAKVIAKKQTLAETG